MTASDAMARGGSGVRWLVSVALGALLSACAPVQVPMPDIQDYEIPVPNYRSAAQSRIDKMVWAFWLRRLEQRGIDPKQSRGEMNDQQNAVVDDVEREQRIYNRYLVVQARRQQSEGKSTTEVLQGLEQAYSGEQLLDEVLPSALEQRRVADFETLLDWVPPSLRQESPPAAAADDSENPFLESLGD